MEPWKRNAVLSAFKNYANLWRTFSVFWKTHTLVRLTWQFRISGLQFRQDGIHFSLHYKGLLIVAAFMYEESALMWPSFTSAVHKYFRKAYFELTVYIFRLVKSITVVEQLDGTLGLIERMLLETTDEQCNTGLWTPRSSSLDPTLDLLSLFWLIILSRHST